MEIWLGVLWSAVAVVVIMLTLWVKWRVDRLIRREVEPALREIREAAKHVDQFVGDARKTLKKIDKAASAAEVLVRGATLASAAGKMFSGRASTIVGVLAGIKEGLRTLRKSESEESKEVTEDDGT